MLPAGDDLSDTHLTDVPPRSKLEMEGPVEEQEILLLIKQLATGKTPGSDSLPLEFYKYFQADLVQRQSSMYKSAWEAGALLLSGRDALIIMLPERGGDRVYRLLFLYNLDYKILGKILAYHI
ncbi:hypothetical protein NDU88_006015 [Pleurodeles waltl]|uniref:Uncharacterized protein n=1 Tax=Pleurodeles waltl TaxID=8319 RepID=A0AAV7QMT0_PLEWA|nr:hypothetical protein NDU88_006015 [Pleurodeles waltl]